MDDYTRANRDAVAQLTAIGAPFEIETQHYEGVPLKAYKNAEPNLAQLMAPGRQFGDATFVQYPGQSLTYNAFWFAVDRLTASLIIDLGIVPGDRVAIAMRNRPEWLIAFTAIIHAGAVVVPLNSWGKSEELSQSLNDSDAKLLICDSPRFRYVKQSNSGITALLVDACEGDNPEHHWEDVLVNDHALARVKIDSHDPAILLFTSGTSGRPKGALFSHFNCCQSLMNIEFIGACTYMTNTDAMNAILGSATPPKTLLSVPLFHISGLFSQFIINLRHGRGLYIMYKWDASEALRLLREEGITVIMGAPAMLLELLSHKDFRPEDANNLSNISAGGAATPEILHNLYREKVTQALSGAGWGMTETGGTGAAFTGKYMHERPGASGFPSPILELSFHDEQGQIVPEGQSGEIWVRSAAAIQRYISGVSDDADFSDGRLKTGDVGYVSEEGLLYLSGRTKDMIIRGGENVYPAEIESCLLTYPGCIEAAVIGMDSAKWGEEVAAVMRCEQPAASGDADGVRAHCEQHLAGFKVPAKIIFTDEALPRNAVQKLLKSAIRDRYFITPSQNTEA